MLRLLCISYERVVVYLNQVSMFWRYPEENKITPVEVHTQQCSLGKVVRSSL